MDAQIVIAAASSLTDALAALARDFERQQPGVRVHLTFGASGTLLQQIRQGAPLDIFVSASPTEMDALARERRLLLSTRAAIAGNRLVLIAPAHRALRGWEDLAHPAVARVALAQPDYVPAGRYAKETLVRRGLWDVVARRAIFAENVRQALAYVATGDVAAGLVFATDAARERRVRIVARATPGKDHTPIVYSAAVLARSRQQPAARRFVAFLAGESARATFVRFGFTAPDSR